MGLLTGAIRQEGVLEQEVSVTNINRWQCLSLTTISTPHITVEATLFELVSN